MLSQVLGFRELTLSWDDSSDPALHSCLSLGALNDMEKKKAKPGFLGPG